MPCVISIPVLHPSTRIWSAGALTKLVGVKVCRGTFVSVAGGMFVFVGKNVGVTVAAGMVEVDVAPIMTGVGLETAGVRVGGTKGVGGLYGRG